MGATVQPGDVVIGKVLDCQVHRVSPLTNEIEVSRRIIDRSTVWRGNAPAVVDKVTIMERCGVRSLLVRLRQSQNPENGDKYSNKAAQKGVMSAQYNQEDLPFTEDGLFPDMVVGPYGFPSRMTIGMLYEMLGGNIAAKEGMIMDATAFRVLPGIHTDKGKVAPMQNFYCGKTGDFIGQGYMCLVSYTRQRHTVSGKIHARGKGPCAPITGQATEGRSNEGGLKIGTMEMTTCASVGASSLVQETMTYHDGREVDVCGCGRPVDSSKPLDRASPCGGCDGSAGPARKIFVPRVTLALYWELMASGVEMLMVPESNGNVKLQKSSLRKIKKPRNYFFCKFAFKNAYDSLLQAFSYFSFVEGGECRSLVSNFKNRLLMTAEIITSQMTFLDDPDVREEVHDVCSTLKRHFETLPRRIVHNNLKDGRHWPIKTDQWCMHDCHPFDTIPVPLVARYDYEKKKPVCFGNFCSPNCGRAYALERKPVGWTLVMSDYSQILFECFGIPVEDSGRVAWPREMLRVFGGDKSIEEFRAGFSHPLCLRLETNSFCVQLQVLVEVLPDLSSGVSVGVPHGSHRQDQSKRLQALANTVIEQNCQSEKREDVKEERLDAIESQAERGISVFEEFMTHVRAHAGNVDAARSAMALDHGVEKIAGDIVKMSVSGADNVKPTPKRTRN